MKIFFRCDVQQRRGFILLNSLVLLLILTILAVGLFKMVGEQHHVTAAMRDKQLAVTNALSAEQYAEWWVLQGSGAANTGVCTTTATTSTAMVCTNPLVAPVTLPWTALDSSGTAQNVGVTYVPPANLLNISTSGGANVVYASPGFYVQYAGPSADGQGILYQINAYGYGGAADSVGVVQDTYEVTSGVVNRGGL